MHTFDFISRLITYKRVFEKETFTLFVFDDILLKFDIKQITVI